MLRIGFSRLNLLYIVGNRENRTIFKTEVTENKTKFSD